MYKNVKFSITCKDSGLPNKIRNNYGKYYNGDFNTVGDYPISSRTWSVSVDDDDIPIPVENVPSRFLNDLTLDLIAQYEGIVAENNYDNTLDPLMNTYGTNL